MSRRLRADELRAACDQATLPFRSTAELTPLNGMIGQERALNATTFGIGMKHGGYNLFVLGLPATGKGGRGARGGRPLSGWQLQRRGAAGAAPQHRTTEGDARRGPGAKGEDR